MWKVCDHWVLHTLSEIEWITYVYEKTIRVSRPTSYVYLFTVLCSNNILVYQFNLF